MTHIYARQGEGVCDYAGNLYATVARDLSVYQASMPKVEDFVFAGEPPQPGTLMPAFLGSWLSDRRNAVIAKMPVQGLRFERWKVV